MTGDPRARRPRRSPRHAGATSCRAGCAAGCRWPARWSIGPRSCSSTSRRSGSTRPARPVLGVLPLARRRPARRCSSRATSWTRRTAATSCSSSCTGALLAQGRARARSGRRPATDDLEAAFLRLGGRREVGRREPPSDARDQPPDRQPVPARPPDARAAVRRPDRHPRPARLGHPRPEAADDAGSRSSTRPAARPSSRSARRSTSADATIGLDRRRRRRGRPRGARSPTSELDVAIVLPASLPATSRPGAPRPSGSSRRASTRPTTARTRLAGDRGGARAALAPGAPLPTIEHETVFGSPTPTSSTPSPRPSSASSPTSSCSS